MRRRFRSRVVTVFPAPNSYTGEDVAEVSVHGSPVLLQAAVAEAMRLGARLAEPGEFTFRAFLNGRIDLVQAEAVRDLIEAVTPLQARAAFDQLEGTLTAEIREIDAALFDLCARLEASLDFPDEGYHFVEERSAASEIDRRRRADRSAPRERPPRAAAAGRTPGRALGPDEHWQVFYIQSVSRIRQSDRHARFQGRRGIW